MRRKMDALSKSILHVLERAGEPLETKEIELALQTSRVKTLYRLHTLRGDGSLKGKAIGSGKGTWIWWNGGSIK